MSSAIGGQQPRRGGPLRTLAVLVVGALLGVVALLIFRPDTVARLASEEAAPTATPTVTVTVTPAPPPGMTRLSVDVPDACLDALRRAGSSAAKVRDLVDALQSLRVNRARELAEELRRDHPEQLGGLTQECGGALDALTSSPSPTPAAP